MADADHALQALWAGEAPVHRHPAHDAVSKRSRLWESSAGRHTYSYDANNRLTQLVNTAGTRASFVYDAAGRRTVRRPGNGTRTSYSYDAADQTTQIFHRTSAGATVAQFDYRYDTAGNRTALIEAGGTSRVTWSYDDQNQLLKEHRTGTNAYRQTYTYDAAGNRTLKNVGGTRTTYAYDVANQLRYGQTTAGRTTYTFDASGNQTVERPPAGSRTTTTWNYENQPVAALNPNRVSMVYNADNRRVQKLLSATVSTKHVWDPVTDSYFSDLDHSNVNQRLYTQEPVPFGNLVIQRNGTTSLTPHQDALGSTGVITSAAQATTDTFLYDAWGNEIARTGTTVAPFRWVGAPGYYFDTELLSYYIRARTYLPTFTRWTSVDPLFLIL